MDMNFSCPFPIALFGLRRLWSGVAGALACALVHPAMASQPIEQVVCTQAPASTWMTEAQAREAFNASQYLLVKFKVSRGHCHEFYALAHDGSVIEAYRHPVTGQTVRMTRIPAPKVSQSQP